MMFVDCTKWEKKLVTFLKEEAELVAIAVIFAVAMLIIIKGLIPRNKHELALERIRKQTIAEDWNWEKKWINEQRQKEAEERKKEADKLQLEEARLEYVRTLAEERKQRLEKIKEGEKKRKKKT